MSECVGGIPRSTETVDGTYVLSFNRSTGVVSFTGGCFYLHLQPSDIHRWISTVALPGPFLQKITPTSRGSLPLIAIDADPPENTSPTATRPRHPSRPGVATDESSMTSMEYPPALSDDRLFDLVTQIKVNSTWLCKPVHADHAHRTGKSTMAPC